MGRHQDQLAVVVGAGPAGETVALLLAKAGWNVQVIEKRKEPREEAILNKNRSIIFALMERGVIALKEAGLEIPEQENGKPKDKVWRNSIAVCKGLASISKTGEKTQQNLLGVDLWITERDTLNEKLGDLIARHPAGKRIKIHYSHQVKAIDFEKKSVSFGTSSGSSTSLNYDLLIAADGIHSHVRQLLKEYQPSLRSEVKMVGKSWKSFTGLPDLDGSLTNQNEVVPYYVYSAAPTRIVVWGTGNGTVGGYMSQPTPFFSEERNNAQAYKQLIMRIAPAYPQEWLDSTAEQLADGPLGHMGINWCNRHCGPSTILLGDAANAITPLLGQGVNSALESSSILAQVMEDYDDIQEACEAYDDRRTPELHALTLLDREGLDRVGAKGPMNLRFVAMMIMQHIIWKRLHRFFPTIFSQSEFYGLARSMNYKQVLLGYKRDEATIRLVISIGVGLVAICVLLGLHRLVF